jgi:L-ascorbate metabolism protein UlaG (beta-lactamase superfamily)
MKITHFGHACLLVETQTARLLFDPGTLSHGFEGVRDLTAVLITHNHADHLDVERLRLLLTENPGAVLLADADSVPLLDGLNPQSVASGDHIELPVASGDHIELPGATIDVLGDTHAPVYRDIPGISNAAYLVDGGAFFHPGDSFVVPEQTVDILALPTSGPWLKVSDAVEYVTAIAPRIAVPMHEAALADTATHYGMIEAFSPAKTAFTPLVAAQPTTFESPR